MEDLKSLKCEVCRVGAPVTTDDEITRLMPIIPEWNTIEENGIKKLIRKFRFKNFTETLAFVSRIGIIAEENGHHPVILMEYGQATVWWWTHKINGLHLNDFIMAAKTDTLNKSGI